MNEQELYTVVGANIRACREKAGLKQKDLAEQVGVKPPFISDIENRGVKVSLYTLRNIAKALKVSIDELLGEKKTPFTPSPVGSLCPS